LGVAGLVLASGEEATGQGDDASGVRVGPADGVLEGLELEVASDRASKGEGRHGAQFLGNSDCDL